MRYQLAIWLVLSWMLSCGAGATELRLADVAGGQDAGAYVTHWRDAAHDATRNADLAVAHEMDRQGAFEPTRGIATFGIDPVPHWFRLDLHRPAGTPDTWWIEIPHPGLDDVRLYQTDENGRAFAITVGDHQPFDARPIRNRNFIFPVRLAPEQTATFYLRVATADTMIVPIRVWTPEHFANADARDLGLIGLYVGLILAMLVYNLFIYLKLRDNLYAYYLVFSAISLLVVGELNGLNFEYLWPNNLWLADRQHVLLPAAAIFAMLAFMSRLFDLQQTSPRLNRAIRILKGLTVTALVVGIFADYPLGHVLILAILPLQSILGIVAGVQALGRGYRPAIYFLAAQGCYQSAVLIIVGNAFGLWSTHLLIQQAIGIGSALEVLLFAQALAERIALLRDQKEEALRRALVAEDAARAKSQVLAAASHDLRQPIQALALFIGVLEKSPDTLAVQNMVPRMSASVAALTELLDTFLGLSQLDSGVITPRLQPVAVSDLFERLIDEFEMQAVGAGLRLKVWLPRGDIVVSSDPGLLLTLLRNLMSNAVRYTPRGGLLLACRRRGTQAVIQVWDSGPGIPAAEHERIFQEFYQIDGARRDSRKGMGLGLSIVARIAALLDCRVALRSRPGRGSVFEVPLPVTAEPPLAAPAPVPPLTSADRHGLVVLIEDDAELRGGLALYLEALGYKVIGAHCAATAIAGIAAAGHGPDIVVADYRLRDGSNGCDAIDAIRRYCAASLPGLIVTGETDPVVMRRIAPRGIALLHKPVAADALARQIEALIVAHRLALVAKGAAEPEMAPFLGMAATTQST